VIPIQNESINIPGKDHGHANGLEDTGNTANGDGVKRALLGEEL